MKRLLLFHENDWLDGRDCAKVSYLHNVFTRVAAEGYEVVWMAHKPLPISRQRRRPRIERADGITVARLGGCLFYRPMMYLFMKRLAAMRERLDQFNLVIDCVSDSPLSMPADVSIPVLPLVFQWKTGNHLPARGAGPVIAANASAYAQLRGADIPGSRIVRAFPEETKPSNSVGNWDPAAGLILATIENL